MEVGAKRCTITYTSKQTKLKLLESSLGEPNID